MCTSIPEAVPALVLQWRRKCWRVILVLDPIAAPLAEQAWRGLPDCARSWAALQAVQQTARRLRADPHAAHARAHEAAREAASAALADEDADERLLAQVLADLERCQPGEPVGLMAAIDPAEIDEAVWSAYASAVQAMARSLWIARHDATAGHAV